MDKFDASVSPSGCAEWREAISAMVDGELAPSEQHRLWEHLRLCPACRHYYRQLQAVQKRLRQTHWAALWAKAVRENARLRRWLLFGVLLAALVSASATVGLVRHFWRSPTMTPQVALGIIQYHAHIPPDWVFNPKCSASISCMGEQLKVPQPRFAPKVRQWERVGICQCLSVPVGFYQFAFQGHSVVLLHFNANALPMKVDAGSQVRWGKKCLHCCVVADKHLLMWREGDSGFVLAVPFGEINPLLLLAHLEGR